MPGPGSWQGRAMSLSQRSPGWLGGRAGGGSTSRHGRRRPGPARQQSTPVETLSPPPADPLRHNSFDCDDTECFAEYYDGGTGVARRPSLQPSFAPVASSPDARPPDEPALDAPPAMSYYDYQRRSPPAPPPHPPPPPARRGSFANSPPVDQQQYFVASPGGSYPPYDAAAPGSAPGQHTPYNPAAYPPQRHAPGYGGASVPADYRYRQPAQLATGPAAYNPSAYQGATPVSSTSPYPSMHRPAGLMSPVVASPVQAGYSQPQYAPPRPPYIPPAGTYPPHPQQQQPYSPGLPPPPPVQSPQLAYDPPPPPPPPRPPASPGYPPPNGYAGGYPSPGQSTLSHSSSQKTYLSRPETHFDSASDSDVSAPTEVDDAPHHPLPSPPNKYVQHPGSQPLPSPPPPTPPSHGSSFREPRRPLPNAPSDARLRRDREREEEEAAESLYAEIEASLMEQSRHTQGPAPLFGGVAVPPNGRSNGHISLSGVYDYYSNESDAEAAFGTQMMQHDEEEAVERDRHSRDSKDSEDNVLPLVPQRAPVEDEQVSTESDGEYGNVDLSMLGGGYAPFDVGIYGDDGWSRDATNPLPSPPQQTPTNNGFGRADSGASSTSRAQQPRGPYDPFAIPDEIDVHPFPEFSAARVDTWGTGGLEEPSERRMSFDEGEQEELARSRSGSPSEMFYRPISSSQNSPLTSRPLPSPLSLDRIPELRPAGTPASLPYPESEKSSLDGMSRQGSIPGTHTSQPVSRQYTPMSADQYGAPPLTTSASDNRIPRATSLSTHTNTPQTLPPVRSKTDGRIHPKSNRVSVISTAGGLGLGDTEMSPSFSPSDLPPIPLTKKFDPKKLSSRDLRKCQEPWALSSISVWLREMTEGEQDLKEAAVADAITALFTHHVPTMNIADAETLAAKVVGGMLREKNLVKDEEWVKFGDGEVGGVVYQVTGNGCYSPKLHEIDCPGRCYAHHCARTLRKITLPQHQGELKQKMEDWATFWKMTKEKVADVDKKEIERQNNLHEIVQTEEEYMEHLRVLQQVYREGIAQANPPIIKPSRLDEFLKDVFGKAEAVRGASDEHLLPQLKFHQREEGPWVVGFSAIFREWIRKAKTAYLEYAASFPHADMVMRREAERNLLFRSFLDHARQDPRTRRLDWPTFLKAPITRLQRYSLLLSTVLKHTPGESDEKENLKTAIQEIKAVTLECDARVDEMNKRVQLSELGQKLIMREWKVDLRLDEMGRELVFKGDLQRTGSNRFLWLETHAILFDHYLVLAKTTMQREGGHSGVKHERYDVSRMPIPMDLLVLESTNDDPIVRTAAHRLGIAGPGAVARPAVDTRSSSSRSNTMQPVPLQHANSSLSVTNTSSAPAGRAVTALPDANAKDDKVLYPFRIKHLGNPARYKSETDNTYILYAPTAQNRKDWCDKIIQSKQRHAESLHAQNAEPFRLNVLADTAFAYDTVSAAPEPKPIRVQGTPLDRAIHDVEKMYEGAPGVRAGIVCRAQVNCATAFTTNQDRRMVAIGTDYGVFISSGDDPRGWRRAIHTTKVTQIAVLEEFSLFLVLADKALVAHHLDVVCPQGVPTTDKDSKNKAPQKLSGGKDVGFFATGRQKERSLVFYSRRGLSASNFKVLEPVFQKATEKKSRFSRKGTTEFFRDFDEFYIPTDCYGMNLFQSSLAIQTSKGFEVMTLDKKHPFTVPDLRGAHVADIASRLTSLKPLGMFRLSEIEFLLVYEECAVYVNKHGDVSRSVIMEFVGKARAASLFGAYLLCFDQDFVEVRNAQNGRLRQVIAGRDVRCLDDGMGMPGLGAPGGNVANGTASSTAGRSVKVCMAHPEVEGRQLVVELVLNEGQRD